MTTDELYLAIDARRKEQRTLVRTIASALPELHKDDEARLHTLDIEISELKTLLYKVTKGETH